MLTEKELRKIFMWLPYRSDWPINRNERNDRIDGYYGPLMFELENNKKFSRIQTQDGSMGNYFEFICYPAGNKTYDGRAVIVLISLCAPIAAYGEIKFSKGVHGAIYGHNFLEPENVGIIESPELKGIQCEIVNCLDNFNIDIIDSELATRKLPPEVADDDDIKAFGNQYLHGLFQQAL